MPAGGSALRHSKLLKEQAAGLFELSQLKLQQARNFEAAWTSEEELAAILRPLDTLGWTVFEDRLWPNSKHANVDFILVGPGGVVIVDAKSWAELEIRDGSLFGETPARTTRSTSSPPSWTASPRASRTPV